MTMAEYDLRITAYRLSQLQQSKAIHEQAWANNQVKATKQVGKKQVPVYSKFKDFFDYENLRNKILGVNIVQKDDKLVDLMKKANS